MMLKASDFNSSGSYKYNDICVIMVISSNRRSENLKKLSFDNNDFKVLFMDYDDPENKWLINKLKIEQAPSVFICNNHKLHLYKGITNPLAIRRRIREITGFMIF